MASAWRAAGFGPHPSVQQTRHCTAGSGPHPAVQQTRHCTAGSVPHPAVQQTRHCTAGSGPHPAVQQTRHCTAGSGPHPAVQQTRHCTTGTAVATWPGPTDPSLYNWSTDQSLYNWYCSSYLARRLPSRCWHAMQPNNNTSHLSHKVRIAYQQKVVCTEGLTAQGQDCLPAESCTEGLTEPQGQDCLPAESCVY